MSAGTAIASASGVDRGRRVVHVITESSPFGGAQRNTLLTLEGLQRDGYAVDLICGAGGELIARARAAGLNVIVLRDLVRTADPWRDLRALWRLYRCFRTLRPHVVHTHSTKAGLLARPAARAAGVPVVVHTFHGFPFVIDRGLRSRIFVALERLVARVTDGSICVAEALRQEVASWKIPRRQALVTIYSGIDLSADHSRRRPEELRAELGLPEDAGPIVGSVGHLRPAKAQQVLIEAAARLRRKYPRLRFLLVGEGEERPRLEQRIRTLGLEECFLLLGERDDVVDLLAIFDVYAMSSLWEGVGRALTEAMLSARPVVVTPVYGVKELVLDGDTGLTVPPRDPVALSAAIDRLLTDRPLARRLGEQARRKVRAQMGHEPMIAAIEQLYVALEDSTRTGAAEVGR